MGLLNWNSGQHYDHGDACPCTQCGKPTPLRAHSGEPVHNPTAPRHHHEGRDLGTRRYHSDPPKKNRKDGAR
ncbi:hypothetical protein ACFWZT_01375 [Streptomyces alboflavus]|uniref:hypothetical protein n=1 Tax=Streptomyces alboflavus TaxID=67267 RepID=UPI0036C30833